MSITERLKGMVYGSFMGDSMALGVHWIYSPDYIRKNAGEIRDLMDPMTSYHPTKKAGDLTHYGDLALFMMEFSRSNRYFTRERISREWYEFIVEYDGYMDHACKRARQNYNKNILPLGRRSIPDFSASSRVAGLIYNYYGDEVLLREKVKEQTILTHNMEFSEAASDFVLNSVLAVLKGKTPLEGVTEARMLNDHRGIEELIEFGMELESDDLDYAIGELGANCYVDGALQTCIYLIKRYQGDINKCITVNASMGGDSAGRGLYLGMILGAYHGYSAIDSNWLKRLNCREKLEKLMK